MRILLTGAGGFIGSNLCRDLVEAGHQVAVLSRDAHPWRIKDVLNAVTLIECNLAELETSASAIIDFRPDAVAHLAWQGVANFDRNNVSQVNNVGWTAELLALGHRAGAACFLGLGSQAECGPSAAAIGSGDYARPTTLYGEAKLAAGRIGARLAENIGMRFVWMRVFSIYGPADHAYWMIPGLIDTLLKRERPALTAGDQLWDFLYVEDAARAIRLALETEAARGVYALGSGDAPSLRSTVEAIRDHIDPDLSLGFGEVSYRPDQVMRLQADISALTRDLGWQPQITLHEGLNRTVAWYRCNPLVFEGRQTSP